MPFDVQEEDEQDEQQGGADPVTTIASYLNPDRTKDGDQKDWGSLFSRVASGPRIQPPAVDASDANAADDGAAGATAALGTQSSATATPADDASSQAAPGWESSFGDSPSSTIDQNPEASDVESPATPDAKDALGDFAAATGTGNQTQLGNLAQPPTAPAMDPDFAKTQADLRAKSAVTPKIDPATGKTLDQYKIGVGGRIGRALKDFGMSVATGHGLLGGAGAVVKGAFGDRNDPGYYGKGAVDSQYGRDEQQRQRDVSADDAKIKSFEDQNTRDSDQFKNQQSSWKDAFDVAHQGDVDAIRQQNADEKSRHDQETEQLKSQLQTATTPQAKADAELKVRTNIAEKIGLAGREKQLYQANGKMPDDDTIQRRLKVEEGRFGLEQAREARESGTTGGQWYTSTKELADYKEQTGSLDREASTLENRKALYTEAGTTDELSKQNLKNINDRLDAIDKQKATIKQGIVSNRPAKSSAAPSSGSTPPADTTDIPAAEFNPRTGEPTAGITATNPDGTPGKAVVSGKKDASGRPTIEIQQPPAAAPQLTPVSISPKPPVPTSGAAPQQVKTQKTGNTVKVGDSVTVGGKTYKVTGINPKTNKPILGE